MADDRYQIDVDSLLAGKDLSAAMEQARAVIRSALTQTSELLKTGMLDFDSVFLENFMEIEISRLDKLASTLSSTSAQLERSYIYDVGRLAQKEQQASDKNKGFLNEEQTRYYAAERMKLQKQYFSDQAALERRHAKAVGDIQEQVNTLFADGRDKQTAKAREYYAHIVQWANDAAHSQIISQEQATDIIGKALSGGNAEDLRSAEKEFRSYLDRRKKLIDRAAKEEARLAAQGKTGEATQTGNKLKTDLSALDANFEKKNNLSGMIADGLGNFGAGQIKEALNLARQNLVELQLKLDELKQLQEQEASQQNASSDAEITAATPGKNAPAGETAKKESVKKEGDIKVTTADQIKAKTAEIVAAQASITAAEQSIKEKNPFVALAMGIEKYNQAKATGAPVGQDVKDIATAAAGSIDKVKGFYDAAVSGLGDLGFEMSAETEQILGDVGKLMSSASGLATGIATGDPAKILTSGIGIISSLFSLFDGKSRRAERRIQALQKDIDGLSSEYKDREKEIKSTNDFSVYDKMSKQEANLKEQQAKIQQQIREEQSKKKVDQKKIDDWNTKIEQLNDKQAELENKRIEMLAGTTATKAIDDFAAALTGAYGNAEKSAQKLQETTKNILSNAVKDSLKKQFLAKGIEKAVEYLGKSMEDGTLTAYEEEQFKKQVEDAGKLYSDALARYHHLFATEDSAEDDKPAEGMRGEISEKITENTASKLEGLFRLGVDLQARLANIGNEQLTVAQSSLVQVADIARSNIAIEENTRRTADNTDGLRERLDTVATELRAIKNNTTDKQLWQK